MSYSFTQGAAFATINISDPNNPTLDIEILYEDNLKGLQPVIVVNARATDSNGG